MTRLIQDKVVKLIGSVRFSIDVIKSLLLQCDAVAIIVAVSSC